MGRHLSKYAVVLWEPTNPVNHGLCTRQEKYLLDRTTMSLRRGRRRSRRFRLDAPKRFPDKTIIRESAKAVSTTVLCCGALLSCGGTTEMCSANCGFPRGLKQNSVPIGFIRRSWMPACKSREHLLRLKRQETVNKPSLCRRT